GQAIRPRIFFGQAESVGQVRIGQAWKTVDFEFVATEDDQFGALHLRFGEEAGDVWFGKITLTDATEGQELMSYDFAGWRAAFDQDWQYWCKGKNDEPPV